MMLSDGVGMWRRMLCVADALLSDVTKESADSYLWQIQIYAISHNPAVWNLYSSPDNPTLKQF